MEWTPLGDRVIVRKLDDQKETSSGIILMEDQRTIKTAEVVAVGPGKYSGSKRVPINVSIGDTVHFHKSYGTDMPDDKYMILHEEDILATESPEN